MALWIYIEEGTYPVDEAFLLTPGNTAAPMEDAVLEVYRDGTNERRVRGSGMVTSLLIVELLEDVDRPAGGGGAGVAAPPGYNLRGPLAD